MVDLEELGTPLTWAWDAFKREWVVGLRKSHLNQTLVNKSFTLTEEAIETRHHKN